MRRARVGGMFIMNKQCPVVLIDFFKPADFLSIAYRVPEKRGRARLLGGGCAFIRDNTVAWKHSLPAREKQLHCTFTYHHLRYSILETPPPPPCLVFILCMPLLIVFFVM